MKLGVVGRGAGSSEEVRHTNCDGDDLNTEIAERCVREGVAGEFEQGAEVAGGAGVAGRAGVEVEVGVRVGVQVAGAG